MTQKRHFQLDTLLLMLLVVAHTQLKGISFLMVIPLFFYLLLDFWRPSQGNERWLFLIRLFLVLVVITAVTILPTLQNIQTRAVTEPDPTGFSPALANIHDGAIQMETALVYLDGGKNPYVESYADTPLKYFGFSGVELQGNPAFDYFVYLPGYLAISFPIYKLFQLGGTPYDQRWVYLGAYIILVLALPLLADAPRHKLALLIGVGLNPLLTGPVIIGMNDVIVALPIVLAGFLLHKKQLAASILLFAVACTLKQSAWLFAPFYLLLFWDALPNERQVTLAMRYLLLFGVVMLLALVPFVLWDSAAFFTDVFAYPSGRVEVNYPIRGYTVGVLLVGGGIIESPLDPFPFTLLQAIFGLPLLLFLLWRQWQQNSVGMMYICAGLFMFGLGLVSRFFQDNYVGFVVTFVVLGMLLELGQGSSESLDA